MSLRGRKFSQDSRLASIDPQKNRDNDRCNWKSISANRRKILLGLISILRYISARSLLFANSFRPNFAENYWRSHENSRHGTNVEPKVDKLRDITSDSRRQDSRFSCVAAACKFIEAVQLYIERC